jgi:hypothetical protein
MEGSGAGAEPAQAAKPMQTRTAIMARQKMNMITIGVMVISV